jgi:pimeloyl-ACP methyl ester carboxylesterase
MIITNSSKENLKASLFTRGEPTDICIVFMHGLGSMRLEGLNLLKELPEGYSLLVFDFSGSGKS